MSASLPKRSLSANCPQGPKPLSVLRCMHSSRNPVRTAAVTRSIGPLLPPTLAALLDGERLETKIGVGFQCLTTTDDGWPYLALVGVGELLTTSSSSMRLAIWSDSTTARNLDRAGRCALALVLE